MRTFPLAAGMAARLPAPVAFAADKDMVRAHEDSLKRLHDNVARFIGETGKREMRRFPLPPGTGARKGRRG